MTTREARIRIAAEWCLEASVLTAVLPIIDLGVQERISWIVVISMPLAGLLLVIALYLVRDDEGHY